jgi:1-phosphatidylinositol-3-phosphate 5-kinase
VADLVKRFQTSGALDPDGDTQDASLPSTPSLIDPRWEESDSDHAEGFRPRLRRGKTEGSLPKNRNHSRLNALSDGDRSYAANASRIPTISAIRRPPRPGRTTSTDAEYNPPQDAMKESLSRATRLPPSLQDMVGRPSSAPGTRRKSKPELLQIGKGKAPHRGLDRKEVPIETPLTSNAKSGKLPGTRVSTIARHFDRLTREAERDRQKRIHQARGRRARPVGMTNAKIQVFNNVRDAFRDDSDSASSEADDEDDDEIDNDLEGVPGRNEKTSSGLEIAAPPSTAMPNLNGAADSNAKATIESTVDSIAATSPPLAIPPTSFPASASASHPEQSSMSTSEVPTDVSFKDRLQITLPPFDTNAPLLSVPPTPLLTGAVEAKPQPNHPSLMSESEGGSVGYERSSILKTLSNLWAFRTGEGTPLEYPL